jgi:NAD(P)-dependent dehydrogenase (short-subunit alcohol dehydrogenase family)
MHDVKGKTAVVTGAASGIGFALCQVFGREGMNVVMADIEKDALNEALEQIKSTGTNAIAVVTDVIDPDSVQALADKSFDTFGNVHILCNNAGVGIKEAARPIWTLTANDWNWGYGVNVMGPVNGIRAFVNRMIENDEEGHVINTVSSNGTYVSLPTTPIYASTKAALTSLTEVMYQQFAKNKTKLKASVMLPGPHWINDSKILISQRNRQQEFQDEAIVEDYGSIEDIREAALGKVEEDFPTTDPIEIAEYTFKGICAGDFWIRPELFKEELKDRLRERSESVFNATNPEILD